MIIDAISDLHGFYPKLEGGDLLIIAGDLTARDTDLEYMKIFHWISKQNYKNKIVVAGNHDNRICNHINFPNHFTYLCDSGTELEGLKLWGSPWTKTFEGMNPKAMAFTCDTEDELSQKWDKIPDDIDILITHGPPHGILDWNKDDIHCGSISLLKRSRTLKNLKLFCFGHIHEAYSMINTQVMTNSLPMLLSPNKPNSLPIIVNASHVNERYEPVNRPIRVIL